MKKKKTKKKKVESDEFEESDPAPFKKRHSSKRGELFLKKRTPIYRRRSGQSVTASDFGSNGPRFESGRGRCVESLDKALYSHCPKEKPSH